MWWSDNRASIEDLLGKTLLRIENYDNDELFFYTAEGQTYKMYHDQDCCESVWLEDTIGDLDDLMGSPITMAECVTEEGTTDSYESSTWTFYKLATNQGYVTLRWLGTSNGYYSESVSFVELPKEKETVVDLDLGTGWKL
jgi:hypothetical protein